ncbi:hypothetical protein [Vibrio phage 29Fa.3]|nr:hypothetical protein [Vibrio phage 29Fa.3]WKC56054.1 hypothetical protein [Vibrio phage CAU_VPP01]
MENVVNTIVVDFTNPSAVSDDARLTLEYDARDAGDGGLNARSTPYITESCYLLLSGYGVSNFNVTASSGIAVFNSGVKHRQITETVIFDGASTGSLRLPATKLLNYSWQGSDGGALSLEGQTLQTVREGNYVAVVTYESSYYEIKLTPPELDPDTVDEYTINVIVSAEVIQ